RIYSDLRDEPFTLTMPVSNHRLGKLDIAGNNQRRDIWQNIRLEKVHVIQAVRFDLRIESQSTMDKFGNRPDLEFIQGDIAVTFEPNRVLPLGHVAHRLATAF